jgi:hypothetical protein
MLAIEHRLPRRWAIPRKDEARTREAGFKKQIVSFEGRYADLSHLLPMFYIEPAVEPGVPALTYKLAS